jgi:hypothetical protein
MQVEQLAAVGLDEPAVDIDVLDDAHENLRVSGRGDTPGD